MPVSVNGRPTSGEHVLGSGDIITLGKATFGFRRGQDHGPVAHPILSVPDFRFRLAEEVERFLRYRGPFGLLVIDLPSPDKASAAEAALRGRVRRVDILGWASASELVAVFPQTVDALDIPARRLVEAVGQAVPEVRGGLARCPWDGCEADALLAAARSGAQAAPRGGIARVQDSVEVVEVGGASIRLADPLMRSLYRLVRQLAQSDLPVLVTGETGVGKEMVSQALHAWSGRSKGKLVAINCAAVPESLLESELFGYQKGAFTGAATAKPGLFENAQGGTVFLDEVGDCGMLAQAKLLRVLETRRVVRVGGLHEQPIDVRVVSATNRDLEQDIEGQRFRKDLYYRLAAAAVVVPPLRDRPLDIAVLCDNFLAEARARLKRPALRLGASAMQRLHLHTWPGNVRELRNLMEYLAASVPEGEVTSAHLPERVAQTAAPWIVPKAETAGASNPQSAPAAPRSPSAPAAPRAPSTPAEPRIPSTPAEPPRAASQPASPSGPRTFRNLYEEIRELEERRIREALEETHGVRVKAAQLIGMPLRTMLTKMRQYQLG